MLGEIFGVQDEPLSRGGLEMPITGGLGQKGGQKSVRAGRRLWMSCSSTYSSEKGWFKCLGQVEELWPGLLVWSEEHCDSSP